MFVRGEEEVTSMGMESCNFRDFLDNPSQNRTCHFYGGVAKFSFLYLPILLLLIANTVMFCFIAYNLFKDQ